MSGTPYDQTGHRVRLEWGPVGGAAVVGERTVAVVVDVLSFTTTVSVAVDSGVDVLPWRWSDRGVQAAAYAEEHAAELAVGRSQARGTDAVSLSPGTFRTARPDLRRVVLPSPNGATTALALDAAGAQVVAGCLRNRAAVAAWLADRLADPATSLALVPAGERWADDGSLRPALEDAYGAGAVLDSLLTLLGDLTLSPEAAAVLAGWRAAVAASGPEAAALLAATPSGRELVGAGWSDDVAIAGELDTSTAVPLLQGTTFVPQGGAVRAL